MNKPADFVFTPITKAPEPELGWERIPVDRYTDPVFLSWKMTASGRKPGCWPARPAMLPSPVIFLFSKTFESQFS